MFWPAYEKDRQHYLHITQNMTSDSVKSYLLASEFNLWKNIIPLVQRAIREEKEKGSKSVDYCEKDGGCEP